MAHCWHNAALSAEINIYEQYCSIVKKVHSSPKCDHSWIKEGHCWLSEVWLAIQFLYFIKRHDLTMSLQILHADPWGQNCREKRLMSHFSKSARLAGFLTLSMFILFQVCKTGPAQFISYAKLNFVQLCTTTGPAQFNFSNSARLVHWSSSI